MNIITTTAPISIDELKKYFESKDTFYVIDYEKSQLKGKKLLTYLSNLDIPSDIKIDIESKEFQELFLEYMESQFLIKSTTLEIFCIRVLYAHRGMTSDDLAKSFVENNKEIVNHWSNIIDSLLLYNMFTLSVDEFQDYAKSYENDDTIKGINFVNLLKYPEFYFLFSEASDKNLKFYNRLFNESVYKGTALFEHWCNENNEIFLMTWGIAEDVVSPEDILKVINE